MTTFNITFPERVLTNMKIEAIANLGKCSYFNFLIGALTFAAVAKCFSMAYIYRNSPPKEN